MNSVYVDGIEASFNYSHEKSINRSNRRPQTFSTSWKWKGGLPFFAPKVRWFPARTTDRTINFQCEKVSFIQSDAANGVFSLVKVHRSHRWLHWLRLNTEQCFHHCHSVSKSQYLYNKKKDKPKIGRRWWDGTFTEDSKRVLTDSRKTAINLVDSRKNWEILTVSRE